MVEIIGKNKAKLICADGRDLLVIHDGTLTEGGLEKLSRLTSIELKALLTKGLGFKELSVIETDLKLTDGAVIVLTTATDLHPDQIKYYESLTLKQFTKICAECEFGGIPCESGGTEH